MSDDFLLDASTKTCSFTVPECLLAWWKIVPELADRFVELLLRGTAVEEFTAAQVKGRFAVVHEERVTVAEILVCYFCEFALS